MIAEAWLPLFLLVAGLGLGAACALAIGRLLREEWLEPLHAALAPLARWAPLLALVLALALPAFAPALYGGDGMPRLARAAAALAAWAALGWWLAAPGGGRRRGGVALAILALSGALAMEDWAAARDPGWAGSVQGVALLAGATLAALALAALLRPTMERPARTGLERALLALALGVLWLWFTQYIVVWAANIPAEAAWYARREAWPWNALGLGVALPALLGGIALAIVPQWADWRLRLVAALLLLNQAASLIWLLRPEAPPGVAHPLADGAALLLAAALAFAYARLGRR